MSRREILKTLGSAALCPLFARTAAIADDPRPEWPDSFFLKENFGPVHEEITAERLPVTGRLPPELDGMFVRNGPNPQFPPRGNYHWFDGDGMVHGVRVQGGAASYRNRYVRTAGWRAERRAGKARRIRSRRIRRSTGRRAR